MFLFRKNHHQDEKNRPALYNYICLRKNRAVPPLESCRAGEIHQLTVNDMPHLKLKGTERWKR
jgi:hypothetical protein